MNYTFEEGRRYRLTILPTGARTKTIEFEGNYLGSDTTTHDFDGRPEMGTQKVYDENIRAAEDVGPARWAR